MATMRSIRRRYGGFICRRCLNKAYHMHLKPSDCDYDYYPHECRRCGETQNIVIRVRLRKRLLLLLK